MQDRTFRPYEPDQLLLLPPSLGEWLPEDHLAYFVSDVVIRTGPDADRQVLWWGHTRECAL